MIEIPTHILKKLTRAEYMAYNTYQLTSRLVNDVNQSVVQSFLCNHYDANCRGGLNKCRQICGKLAQFLNTLQAAKLQQLAVPVAKLLTQFFVERVREKQPKHVFFFNQNRRKWTLLTPSYLRKSGHFRLA